jgi:hypothetical protein
MIAPAATGVTRQTLVDRLNQIGNVEIVRSYAERENISSPIAVVRLSDENAAALRRSSAGAFVIEPDWHLRAASFAGRSFPAPMAAAVTAFGPGFRVTIQALSASGEPVAGAAVQLVGEQATAQGLTGNDGKADLDLFGELPETITDLFITARSAHWGLWRYRPELRSDTVNSFALQSLSLPKALDWGGRAMRFDQLPAECRGAGIKIALIDSGVAISGAAKNDRGRRTTSVTARRARASSAPLRIAPMASAAMHRTANCMYAGFRPTRVAVTSSRRWIIACRPASMPPASDSVASVARRS